MAHPWDPKGVKDPKGTISTWVSNQRMNPLALTVEDIRIEDIAHALARQCRYNGHCWGFLSVARHSLWVSDLCPPGLELTGLLHDASETYLGDMVRPLKHASEMVQFRKAEGAAEQVIAERFGLPFPLPEIVHEMDKRVCWEREMPWPDGARHTWTSTPQEDEIAFLAAFSSWEPFNG